MKHLFITNKNKIALVAMLLFFLATFSNRLHAQDVSGVAFAVKKEGTGKPVIFIPGLDCSGKVWDNAVLHFKKNFTCYTITLPGFAGQPPIQFQSDAFLKEVVRQLSVFIRQNKLIKPVIVGHSLGGWLALDFAAVYPDLAGDIIVVSSAPFLPALSMGLDITVDSARKIGAQIKKGMTNQSAAQVRTGQKAYMSMMIRDTDKIALVTEMAVLSDQPTQGEVMYELFSSDIRPLMGSIKSRILVLGDWSSYKQYGATRENVYANYKEQFKLAHQVAIAMNDDSKHFIMFDEPQWFYSQADSFLFNK